MNDYKNSLDGRYQPTLNGGAGSGNFGHSGRIGEVGGSAPSGGGMSVKERKQKQFDLLQKTNPMTDDQHTGIRSADEIKTYDEIMENYDPDEEFVYPDWTVEDAQKAMKKGKVTVYHGGGDMYVGCFITPSKMMATDYNGGKEPKSMEVDFDQIAWVNADEGNYLPLDDKK